MKTPKGDGQVLEVVSWADYIGMMSDAEARDFTRRLTADLGNDYRKLWRRVLVARSGKTEWFEAPRQIEVLDEV